MGEHNRFLEACPETQYKDVLFGPRYVCVMTEL